MGGLFLWTVRPERGCHWSVLKVCLWVVPLTPAGKTNADPPLPAWTCGESMNAGRQIHTVVVKSVLSPCRMFNILPK